MMPFLFAVTKLDGLPVCGRPAGDRRPAGSQEGQPPGPVDVRQSTPRYRNEHRAADVIVIAAVGQAEREAMLERQREGIAQAKRDGRYKGLCADRPAAGC